MTKFLYLYHKQAQKDLSGFQAWVNANLQRGEVLHSDETGLRVAGELHWMHVASNERFTAYHLDRSRGKAAIERAGILPDYQGTLVHDRFVSYFGYACDHGLCTA
ncbi:MAG: transposase, partial [Bacteroidota bacterium]